MSGFLAALAARVTTALWTEEEGQTAVEYALVLILVAIVLATALGAGLNTALSGAISKVTDSLK